MDSVALLRSEFEEIAEQVGAFFGQEAFGVELDTMDGVVAVSESHDFEGLAGIFDPGGDFEAVRYSFAGDDQAVVAGGLEGVGESGEDALTGVRNHGCFAVHQSGGADDLGAEDISHALVSEADPEHGNEFSEVGDDTAGKAGFLWAAGAGRDDNAAGLEVCNLVD